MSSKIHVVVIPYPVQGHINPMLQFSKRLASKNIKVTLIATTNFTKSLQQSSNPSNPINIEIEQISDGFPESEKPKSIEEFVDRFKAVTSHIIPDLIRKLSVSVPVRAIVYDSFMPWILEISRDLGIRGGSFFTHSCAVTAIYYHTSKGEVKSRIGKDDDGKVVLPALMLMGVDDLPSFVSDRDSYPGVLKLVLDRFSNFQNADWLFFNTFDLLEEELVRWMATQWPVKTIGPTIPSMYMDKRLQNDKDYGLSLFKPDVETCTSWLDKREPASVVYVSFGSLASYKEGQMEEISSALLKTKYHYLWVIRDSETSKIPKDLFLNDLEKKILVVNWCPQLDVLSHRAVGCFITHSGWNSTLEGLSLGVPMVTLPQWADQPTNAKYVVDLWGSGVRVKADENGLYKRDEIEKCVKEVMEGEKGVAIRNNVAKWKKLANEAVAEGGSSDKNIDDFINSLLVD